MQPPPLPEIAVDKASPEVLGIYTEISRLAGIPLPALIWRHLATFPGVLEATWAALAPLYRSGAVQEAAWGAVRASLATKSAGPSATQLSAVGSSVDDVSAYRAVLRSYNRANPVNFVGVRLLLSAVNGPQRGSTRSDRIGRSQWSPPAPITDLVPMVPVEAIPRPLRRLIDELAVSRTVDRDRVVPSLYRHLVPWPRVVEAIHAALRPRIESGELGRLVDTATVSLQAEADALAGEVGPLALVAEAPGVIEALRAFSGLIPEMVVVGALLEHAL